MFSRIKSTEQQLFEAKARLRAACTALAPKHKGGEWEEFRAARSDVLRLERELAEIKGEPYAISCNFPVKWDVGAPLPVLLRSDYCTYLIFYVSDPDPNFVGTTVKIIDPSSSEAVSLCLVTFSRCTSAKLGHPNDEVQRGHPLAGRGLEGYTAQIVKNSPWLKEVAKTNSVHRNDQPHKWNTLNHYVFWFHDSTFECLAESYEVEVTSESMPSLLSRVCGMLLG